MAGKPVPSDLDCCEMTVLPGRMLGPTRTIAVDGKAGEDGFTIDLFGDTGPVTKPVRIEIPGRTVTLAQKPLSHVYDSHIANFKSYYTPLLHFLRKEAFNYQQIGNTCTSLIFDEERSALLAFCSTKCSSMKVQGDTILSLCPSVEIAALCVDDNYRMQGIGQAILQQILRQIQHVRTMVGVQYVTLFAVPGAVDFYKKFGFKKISATGKVLHSPAHIRCVPMYISLPGVE